MYGYGLISLDNLLSVDPTSYPDVNPLIRETPDAGDTLVPTYAEIFNAEPDSAPSATPTAQESEPNPLLPPIGVIIAIAVGALVLIGVLALVVLSLVRRSRRTQTPPNGGPTS